MFVGIPVRALCSAMNNVITMCLCVFICVYTRMFVAGCYLLFATKVVLPCVGLRQSKSNLFTF